MHKLQKIIDLVKEVEHKQICSDSCIAGGCKKENGNVHTMFESREHVSEIERWEGFNI